MIDPEEPLDIWDWYKQRVLRERDWVELYKILDISGDDA